MAEFENIAILADVTRAQAKARPDKPALVFGDRQTTYGELDRAASRVANGLGSEGLGPQTRIAQIGKNSDVFYEMFFGCAKANCVLVPVNWRLAPPEIAYIINDAGAELLLVGADFVEVIEGLLDQLPSVKKVIAIDGGHGAWPAYGAWRDAQPAADPDASGGADDVVVQMYTSGTTGHPKGAELTNRGLTAELRIASEGVGQWREDDISLIVMPQFHIAGTMWGVFGIYVGAKGVVMHDVVPPDILTTIERERITKLFLVPAVIFFLLHTPGCRETDFSSLELIVYGASPITQDLLRQAVEVFGCGFAQVYGLTETSGAITYLGPEDHGSEAGDRLLSCGKPLKDIEVRVVGADGDDLAAGEVGEIITRSALNLKSYWNQPEATAAAIRGDWFYTGDAGYLDTDGYLYIYDRVKDMIISGGENIYPAEIESALANHPAVADVGVIGVPDPEWGESVKAIVVKAPETEVTVEELIAFAREHIAGYKVPKSIDFVEALPRNPSGKILTRELREPYWEEQERQVG